MSDVDAGWFASRYQSKPHYFLLDSRKSLCGVVTRDIYFDPESTHRGNRCMRCAAAVERLATNG